MTAAEAVTFINKFPILNERVDTPTDLFEMPHVTYGLLATEALEHTADEILFDRLCTFIDELANSGDELLEELLVLDVLEGIAQNSSLAARVRARISPNAGAFLARVESDFSRLS